MNDLPLDLPVERDYPFHGVNRTILPNGIVVYTQNKPGEESFSFQVSIGMGDAYEDAKSRGVFHEIEHMLMNPKMEKEMDVRGIFHNATTNEHLTDVYAVAEDHDSVDDLLYVIDLFYDGYVNFDQVLEEYFKPERRVIRIEHKNWAEDPNLWLHHEVLFRQAFRGTPIGKYRWTSGKEQRLATKETMRRYFRNYVVPYNMAIAVTGGLFDEAKVIQKLVDTYGQIPQRGIKALSLPTPSPITPFSSDFEKRNLELQHVGFLWRGPSATTHDFLLANVLADVLYNGSGISRLNTQLRTLGGKMYHMETEASSYGVTGDFFIAIPTLPKLSEQVSGITFRNLHDIGVRGHIEDDEFVSGKKAYRRALRKILRRPGLTAETLLDSHFYPGVLSDPYACIERVNGITKDELAYFAKRQLNLDDIAYAVTGPQKISKLAA